MIKIYRCLKLRAIRARREKRAAARRVIADLENYYYNQIKDQLK